MAQIIVYPCVSDDYETLANIAARTFPLACPPHTTDRDKADFIAKHLDEECFQRYLSDPSRRLFIAMLDGEDAGYAMLVLGEPADPDVVSVVTARPTVELSKLYVLPEFHGEGVASRLLMVVIDAAVESGATSLWLGVNQENQRAKRFYDKHGFAVVGNRRFLVGERYEDDFVCELQIA